MVSMEQIEALSQQIVSEFHPEQIVLFGSYAVGQPAADSDVDLLVVLPFEGYPFRKASQILRATDPDFAVDLLARTPEQIQHRLALGDSFIKEILDKGKVLHEAARARMGK
jgi:predicted nucleotidyltransferase